MLVDKQRNRDLPFTVYHSAICNELECLPLFTIYHYRLQQNSSILRIALHQPNTAIWALKRSLCFCTFVSCSVFIFQFIFGRKYSNLNLCVCHLIHFIYLFCIGWFQQYFQFIDLHDFKSGWQTHHLKTNKNKVNLHSGEVVKNVWCLKSIPRI